MESANTASTKKNLFAVDKVRGKLQGIVDTYNRYADKAKDYVISNAMIEAWEEMILDIESN